MVNCATAGLKEGKKLSGEALSPGFRSWCLEILQKITPASQDNSQRLEPVIRVPQTQSAFHPPAQRSASRRRDVRLQSRLFARWNQWLVCALRRCPPRSVSAKKSTGSPKSAWKWQDGAGGRPQADPGSQKTFSFFNALETAAPVVSCTYENAFSSRALCASLVFNCDIRWKTILRRWWTCCQPWGITRGQPRRITRGQPRIVS